MQTRRLHRIERTISDAPNEGLRGLIKEKKQDRRVTTFTALSQQNSQIAETPLMQVNRINAIDAYVLY